MNRILFLFLLVVIACEVNGQHYQAIHGSSYGGSLGVTNNPASALNPPYAWDITPFAIQTRQSTNIVRLKNFSLLSGLSNIEASMVEGEKERFLFTDQDIHLLNGRIRLGDRQAIAFGLNIRSVISASSSRLNWADSVLDLRMFLDINRNNSPMSAEVRASSWAEIYGTYSRNIIDNGTSILNAGITVKVMRGLASAHATAKDIHFVPDPGGGFLLQSGEFSYGYSYNIDDLDSNGSFGSQRKRFLERTYSSVGASIGLEYIMPGQMEGAGYDLKIGVAVLDLGSNKYLHSGNSRYALFNKDNIFDTTVENSFRGIGSIEEFNDSLASIAGVVSGVGDLFRVSAPTRLVVNADKHLTGNFFINAELTLPLISSLREQSLYVKDMGRLAVTPRYETRNLGLYLPVTIGSKSQFWIGGALRAGPVLLGLHNWANLFSKNKMHNGGAYLAFTIRPGKDNDDSGMPGSRMSKKQKRQLDCPKF